MHFIEGRQPLKGMPLVDGLALSWEIRLSFEGMPSFEGFPSTEGLAQSWGIHLPFEKESPQVMGQNLKEALKKHHPLQAIMLEEMYIVIFMRFSNKGDVGVLA